MTDKNIHTLIVMMGISGSGKSTLAKSIQNIHKDTVIVSRDAIRFALLKDTDSYFDKEKIVVKNFYNEIITNLKNHKYVIADATHITVNSRRKLFDGIYKSAKEQNLTSLPFRIIGIWMDVPLSLAIKQNDQRQGRACVSDTVIKEQFRRKISPTPVEPFDDIIYVDVVYNQAISKHLTSITTIEDKLHNI